MTDLNKPTGQPELKRLEQIWGRSILREGFTAIPNSLLVHLTQLDLTGTEFLHLVQIVSYRHSRNNPFPSLSDLATLHGCTTDYIKQLNRSLIRKGIIKKIRVRWQRRLRTYYDIRPLINRALTFLDHPGIALSTSDFFDLDQSSSDWFSQEQRDLRNIWTAELLADGFTAIPNLMVQRFFDPDLSLTPREWLHILYIGMHKYDVRLPFPSLKTLSQLHGIKVTSVSDLNTSLVNKGLLCIPNRRVVQLSNRYDITPLIQQILQLDQQLLVCPDGEVSAETLSRQELPPCGQDGEADAETNDSSFFKPSLNDNLQLHAYVKKELCKVFQKQLDASTYRQAFDGIELVTLSTNTVLRARDRWAALLLRTVHQNKIAQVLKQIGYQVYKVNILTEEEELAG